MDENKYEEFYEDSDDVTIILNAEAPVGSPKAHYSGGSNKKSQKV